MGCWRVVNILHGEKPEEVNITSITKPHLELRFCNHICAIHPNPHILFILKRSKCENDNASKPRVSMATLICILKNDAVGGGGVTRRERERERECRTFPINAGLNLFLTEPQRGQNPFIETWTLLRFRHEVKHKNSWNGGEDLWFDPSRKHIPARKVLAFCGAGRFIEKWRLFMTTKWEDQS